MFSGGPDGAYIVNEKTGERMPLKEKKGTFVLEVELLDPEAVQSSGFTGQGK